MSISLLWLEHKHTPETISGLNARVSSNPDTLAYDVALSLPLFLADCIARILFE